MSDIGLNFNQYRHPNLLPSMSMSMSIFMLMQDEHEHDCKHEREHDHEDIFVKNDFDI
jgi:hypothetical protein